MFDGLKADVDRARGKAEYRQRRKFAARALEVRLSHVTAAFETNGGEGLVAYFYRERGKVWMQHVGHEGALYGSPSFIGNYADAAEHVMKAGQGDGWEWDW